ncbi:MAG: type II toxin-antitoxin system VapC family toxin [Deltaproteobacteria bacterium]|nr:type II toxin-antitoxin system VapC family toxin [Candidatus Tharpella aukensis]
MLVDTDVIIWYMRGNPNALKILEKYRGFTISVVTYMELVQGMRNKNELATLRRALKSWNTKIIYITEEISSKAMFYVEQHYLSHSVQLADALIGATAVSHGISLLTGNDKHYKIVKEIKLSKFKP